MIDLLADIRRIEAEEIPDMSYIIEIRRLLSDPLDFSFRDVEAETVTMQDALSGIA